MALGCGATSDLNDPIIADTDASGGFTFEDVGKPVGAAADLGEPPDLHVEPDSGPPPEDVSPSSDDIVAPPADVPKPPVDAAAECGTCDDGLACTDDACALGVCVSTPRLTHCVIGDQCVAAGDSDPANSCRICVPSSSQQAWTPLTAGPCEDGDLCTEGDTCFNGSCVPGGAKACPAGACEDVVGCDSDSGSCVFAPKAAGAPCVDGLCSPGLDGLECLPGDGLPLGTVVWFDRPECPSGWQPYSPAIGRTISGTGALAVAEARGDPLLSGAEPLHSHTVAGTGDVGSVSYAGIVGCCNGGLASDADISYAGEAQPASAGLPYLQLLPCEKVSAAVIGGPPQGLGHFSVFGCADGAAPFPFAADRLLVGAPAEGALIASFGSGGLTSHDHEVAGTLPTPSQGIALISGCCGGGYASSGGVGISTATSEATAVFPEVALNTCEPAPLPEGSVAAAPLGAVMFATEGDCPEGWTRFNPGAGRLFVGAGAPGDVGVSVGAPLGNLEDRTHTHAVSISAALSQRSIAAANGGNSQGAAHGALSTTIASGPAASGAAFLQVAWCIAQGQSN